MANFHMDDGQQTRSILMDRLYLHFAKIIPDLAVARGQFEIATRMDHAMTGTVVQLRGWLLNGHKIDRADSNEIEFPASPWQFFKQQYAPKWWLRRWPVVIQMRTITVAIHHHYICPHVAVDPDNLRTTDPHYLWMGEMSGQLPGGSIEKYEATQRESQMY
jgi:hypothetical protein